MRAITLAIVFIAALTALSCASDEPSHPATVQGAKGSTIPLRIETEGNTSFVHMPESLNSQQEDAGMIVMVVLARFKHEHPEWTITSWHEMYTQVGYSMYIQGIFVDHIPSQQPLTDTSPSTSTPQ